MEHSMSDEIRRLNAESRRQKERSEDERRWIDRRNEERRYQERLYRERHQTAHQLVTAALLTALIVYWVRHPREFVHSVIFAAVFGMGLYLMTMHR
jgi:hypothetical protein